MNKPVFVVFLQSDIFSLPIENAQISKQTKLTINPLTISVPA